MLAFALLAQYRVLHIQEKVPRHVISLTYYVHVCIYRTAHQTYIWFVGQEALLDKKQMDSQQTYWIEPMHEFI